MSRRSGLLALYSCLLAGGLVRVAAVDTSPDDPSRSVSWSDPPSQSQSQSQSMPSTGPTDLAELLQAVRERLVLPISSHVGSEDVWRAFVNHVDYFVIVFFVAYFATRVAQRRHNRSLRAAKSSMSYARHRDATYTSVETGLLEWINHVLRHEWRAVLGPKVDELARETLAGLVKRTKNTGAASVVGLETTGHPRSMRRALELTIPLDISGIDYLPGKVKIVLRLLLTLTGDNAEPTIVQRRCNAPIHRGEKRDG